MLQTIDKARALSHTAIPDELHKLKRACCGAEREPQGMDMGSISTWVAAHPATAAATLQQLQQGAPQGARRELDARRDARKAQVRVYVSYVPTSYMCKEPEHMRSLQQLE